MKRRFLIHPLFLTVSVAGCGILGLGDIRHLADLGGGEFIPLQVTVPDTVSRNTAFSVSIAYYGSGSCTRLDEVELRLSGSVATLRPYVKVPRSGDCSADLHKFTTDAAVMFSAPGPAQVRVVGRDTTVVRLTTVR